MLRQFFAMDQQMLTKERAMEMLGEDGITMNVSKVSPAEIAGRVNFQITALPQIEMAGLEAKMIMNFLAGVQPFMAMPGNERIVKVDKLLQIVWERMFGTGQVDKIFPSAEYPVEYRSTMDEHIIIGMGSMLEPQMGENYMEHFNQHTRFAGTPTFGKWPEDAKQRLAAHIQSTALRVQAEIEQGSPRMPMQPGTPMPGMQPGMQPGGPQQGMQLPGPPGMPPGQMGAPGGGQNGPAQMRSSAGPNPQGGGVTTTQQVRSNAQSMAPRTKKDGF
jgi:hypothetical protein